MKTTTLRPVAHWVHETDDRGRDRLVMRWELPDPDGALSTLAPAAAEA